MESTQFQDHTVILDGSHNPQKVNALVKGLQQQYGTLKMPVLVSFGQNKQKDIHNTLSELHKICDDIILTKFSLGQDEIRKAIKPELLKIICEEIGFQNISVNPRPIDAFQELLQRNSKQVLVTGSYYLLNHVRPIIKG